MAGKRGAKTINTTKAATPTIPNRLDALLHTIRCIAQHEDQLCTLLHEARRSGTISPRLRKDLYAVLNELPAEEYTFDLHALEEELTAR